MEVMAKVPTAGLPGGDATWADGSGFYIPNNPYRPAHPEMFEERTRQLFREWKQKIFDQTKRQWLSAQEATSSFSFDFPGISI